MSQERNLKWLHDRRVIYARNPITDVPTESTDLYDYDAEGTCLLYTSPSPRDVEESRMPSSA